MSARIKDGLANLIYRRFTKKSMHLNLDVEH